MGVWPRVAALVALSLSVWGGGCICEGEEPIALELEVADKRAEPLPVLASGAKRIGGIPLPIPDSHGYVDVVARTGNPNASSVFVSGLHVVLSLADEKVPVRVTRIEGTTLFRNQTSGHWGGSFPIHEEVRIWWTVERKAVADRILPLGAEYVLAVVFEWSHGACPFEEGAVHEETTGRIGPQLRRFHLLDDHQVDVAGDAVGFRANFTVTAGVDVTLHASSALAVRIGDDEPGAAAVIPRVAWSIDGSAGNVAEEGDRVATASARADSIGDSFARSGAVQPPGAGSGGTWLVVEALDYREHGSTNLLVEVSGILQAR